MTRKKIAIGFIVYGEATAKYLPEFLASLRGSLSQVGSDWQLYAWDNQPANQTNRQLLNQLAPEAHYLELGDNLGFGAAYNRLFALAKDWGADYFLVVNPDTYWSDSALPLLLAALELDDNLASVTPKVLSWDFAGRRLTGYLDSCGLLRLPGLRFVDLGQGELDRGQYNQASINGVSGCAALYRLKALYQVAEGGDIFDREMFMYKEDCDLARRLELAGFGAALVPDAKVWHDRTAAAGQGWRAKLELLSGKSAAVRRWSLTNQLRLVNKHWRQESYYGLWCLSWDLLKRLTYTLIIHPGDWPIWRRFFQQLW